MHKIPDICVMQKIPVSSVVYRIADSAPSVLISDLCSERRILYISVDNRLRDLCIEMRSVSNDTSVKRLTVHPFSDIPFCSIVTCTGHIVAAASEPCVDLKEFVDSISRIIFDIEIGKSDIPY